MKKGYGRYDGFYAVATDLEDEDLSLIINANRQRWEIEESFETNVCQKERSNGHLVICFIALLV